MSCLICLEECQPSQINYLSGCCSGVICDSCLVDLTGNLDRADSHITADVSTINDQTTSIQLDQAFSCSCGRPFSLVKVSQLDQTAAQLIQDQLNDLAIQRANLVDFYTTTQASLWRLPGSQQDYYQAELKNLTIVEDQVNQLKQLGHYGLTTSAILPHYHFQAPGRIIKAYNAFKRVVSVVTDNFYWDYVTNHSNLPWHYASMQSNANITPDIFDQLRQRMRFPAHVYIQHLRHNPNFKLSEVRATTAMSEQFYRNYLASSQELTFEYLYQHRNEYRWDWAEVSANPQISLANIIATIRPHSYQPAKKIFDKPYRQTQKLDILPWSFQGLSKNPNLTWDFVCEHLTEAWDWTALSANPAMTWTIMQAHPGKTAKTRPTKGRARPHWEWSGMSSNPTITAEIMQERADINWRPRQVSANVNITMATVEAYPDYPGTPLA